MRRKAGRDEIRRERYFKLEAAWWEAGVVQRLSGPGLAILLILLSEGSRARDEQGIWLSPSGFQDRYGLSVDTRRAGLRELQKVELVQGYRMLSDSFFEQQRQRVYYRLLHPFTGNFAEVPPPPPPKFDPSALAMRIKNVNERATDSAATSESARDPWNASSDS